MIIDEHVPSKGTWRCQHLPWLSTGTSQEFCNESGILSDRPCVKIREIYTVVRAERLVAARSRSIAPSADNMYHLLLLALSGDIALNPGPHTNAAQVFPCGYCQLLVTWEVGGVACDDCSLWFHISCHDMNVSQYVKVNDASWKCFRCNRNLSTDTVRDCYSCQHIETRNMSSRMSSVSSLPSSGSPAFQPVSASTPVLRGVNATSSSSTPDTHHPLGSSISTPPTFSTEASSGSTDLKTKDRNTWRTLVLNTNSILSRKKSDALEALMDYTKPDAILISETKLDSTISNSCFPEGYTIIRKIGQRAVVE